MTDACSGTIDNVYDSTPTDRLFRPGWSTFPALQAADTANQPGHAPTTAPVLVIQGTADNLIPEVDTTRLVTDGLCDAQSDIVRYVTIPGAGHEGALDNGQPVILRWIASRLAGQVPTDTCPRDPGPELG
jgi:pimeloyl-ACP methyl ester carboxylesterase